MSEEAFMARRVGVVCLLLLLLSVAASAQETEQENGESRTLVEEGLERDRELISYSGAFMPHRRSYLLPISWQRDPNQTPSSPVFDDQAFGEELQREEIKFQFSFKLPLLTGFFDDRTRLWFAYTQLSLWQAYNFDESSPFRETNFEPELFLSHELGWELGPGRLELLTLGVKHQSNGREDPFSRGWDRIKGDAVYSTNRWAFTLTSWYRIPESERNDDNPDIESFLGHGEFNVTYSPEGTYSLGARFLNNLRSTDNRTSVELSWAFPLGRSFKAYFQYYNGYGETLIDYNKRTQRFGIGFALNDWF